MLFHDKGNRYEKLYGTYKGAEASAKETQCTWGWYCGVAGKGHLQASIPDGHRFVSQLFHLQSSFRLTA